MSEVYNPWMSGSEEDVTDEGFVSPEYMDMMQGEPEAEPGEELPGQPEEDADESEAY